MLSLVKIKCLYFKISKIFKLSILIILKFGKLRPAILISSFFPDKIKRLVFGLPTGDLPKGEKNMKAFKNIKIEALNTVLVLSIVALTVFYLFMTNSVVMANYQKTMLQKNIDNLRMEIRILNLELSDKRSIGFLKKAAQDLNLVVNDQIHYVKIAGPVAKNQ